jgi:hypothetical protein
MEDVKDEMNLLSEHEAHHARWQPSGLRQTVNTQVPSAHIVQSGIRGRPPSRGSFGVSFPMVPIG